MFPFLKIFGNENGIFRCTPGNFAKRWVFSWVFTSWSKVAPRGWVFSLSFLLELFPWVLVFSAADVKKKPVLRLSANRNQGKQKFNYLYNNRQQTHALHFGIDGVTNSSSEYVLWTVIHVCSTVHIDNIWFRTVSVFRSFRLLALFSSQQIRNLKPRAHKLSMYAWLQQKGKKGW